MLKLIRIPVESHFFNTFLFSKRSSSTEAKFEITQPFKLHRLDQGPSTQVTLTKEDALALFERMSTIRKMEASINTSYKAKLVRGFCHLYSGQEAVAVGVHYNVRPQDIILTSYRNHSWSLLNFGLSPVPVIAELFGNKSGCARGKGGSMHMYGKNFFGGQAIVGSQVPLGVGVALSFKYRNTDGVSVTVYGDGAANNGQVFEVFNIAKLWNLPVFFLCENNIYGMGTSVQRCAANPNFYTRGDLIPGVWADGMDVLAVREAARFAIAHASSGKGPIIIEAQTYRYFGHSLSDPGTSYRTREEIQEVRQKRDPITNFKQKIIDAKLVTEDELKQIDNKCKKVVEDATEAAKKDVPPGIEELTQNVYANEIIKEIRGVTHFRKHEHKTVGQPINLK